MTQAPARTRRRITAPAAGLAVAVLAAAGVLLLVGRHVTYYADDWYFIPFRRGLSADTLLRPHNEHLSLLLVLAYKALLAVFGWDHVLAFKATLVAILSVNAVLLYGLVQRAVAPVIALALVIPVLLPGAAWSAVLSPFQMSFAGSVGCGLAALLALERVPGTRGGALAAALAFAGILWSGTGLTLLVVVAVEAVLCRGVRALWVGALPALGYLAWWIPYHLTGGQTYGAGTMLRSLTDGMATGVSAYAGLGGRPAFVASALLLVLATWRIVRMRRVPSRTLAALAGLVSFWVLVGYLRGPDAYTQSRYLYPVAVLLVLAAAPLLPRGRPPALVGALALVLALLAVALGWNELIAGRNLLVGNDAPGLARLRATEIAGPRVDPAFVPDPANNDALSADIYLRAVRDLGSPASPVSEIRRMPGPAPRRVRRNADRRLADRVRPGSRAGDGSGAPPAAEIGRVRTDGSCVTFGGAGTVALLLSSGRALTVGPAPAPIGVRLRLLGDPGADQTLPAIAAGTRARLALPATGMPDRWHLALDAPAGTRACAA